MHRIFALSCLISSLIITGTLAAEGVPVTQTDGKATIDNSLIRVEFDLARGTYDAVDLRDASRGFRNARFQVGPWDSSQKGMTRRATSRSIEDSLGKGQALLIECAGKDQPTLLLEITLYDQKSFVVLRSGIENATRDSLRLNEFHPIAFAQAFPGASQFTEPRTLNAEGGGRHTSVEPGLARLGSNNVLATFRDGDQRRSVVLGGLSYHEWMKSAGVWPNADVPSRNAQRRRDLARQFAAAGGNLSAYLDCGPQTAAGTAPGVELRTSRGKPFDFASVFAAPCYNTVAFDNKQVEIEATGLDPNKSYSIGFSWWDYNNDGRIESVYLAAGDGSGKTPLLEKTLLPAYAMIREQLPVEKTFAVPKSLHASGKMKIIFAFDEARAQGSNAVVSEVWIAEVSTDLDHNILARPSAFADSSETELYLHAEARDPVGRRVDAGTRYLPEDRFYVDFSTDDPFAAAEQYGLAVRAAHQAKPNPYTFPTICSWYAGVTFVRGAQNHPEKSRYAIATTKGHVEEMDFIRTTGFLNYSTVAIRLVPDNYTANNPQGWWDDRHWQEQGFYTPPYETSKKWGQALHDRGGLAFTYFQSDRVSADFRRDHPELLLSGHRTLDYTKPETQRYMAGVYAPMRGNVNGAMFDYCDEFWCFNLAPGGFHDDRATAASVYRLMFQLAKSGLGPRSWIHERPIENPGSDMAVGLIDSQRTSGDTADISPGLIARSGLRWYKNRVFFAYDMDSKNLLNAWKRYLPKSTDRDGRRMTLTMSYVTASRLLLANSFRDFSAEAMYDVQRTFPFHGEPKSARPLDAFVNPGPPRVYDFAVNPDWHQLTLFNTDGNEKAEIVVPLSGERAGGAMGLDPGAQYYAYDFWNDAFVGQISGKDAIRQTLRPGEARMMSVHRVEPRPQFLSTNRHLMQGYVDMPGRPNWNDQGNALRATSNVIGGEAYEVILAANGYRPVSAQAEGAKARIEPIDGADGLFRLILETPENASVPWTVQFARP
ncbi:MAG: hypothetical protein JW719_05000 [Pirellulales bacterium]|nr:hypothetical protein [Pirellulales bacterium]